MGDLISQREFARQVGVSHTAVQQAVRVGRLTLVHGKIDPERAAQEWHARGKQPVGNGAEPVVPADDAVPPRHVSEAKFAAFKADLAELEVQRRRGEVVDVGKAKREAFEVGTKMRDAILLAGDRVALELLHQSDLGVVRRKLRHAYSAAYESVAGAA